MDPTTCVKLLEQTLVLEPDLEAARELVLETFLGRGREALEEGRFAPARDYFDRALKVDPQGYESLYWASVTASFIPASLVSTGFCLSVIISVSYTHLTLPTNREV